MTIAEKQAKMEMGSVDRMSELPEFILHTILSFLNAKEAGRVTLLSKYWYAAWSSTPDLDFRPFISEQSWNALDELEDWYYNGTGKQLVECIDETMQRYFEQKHRITKLYLLLPIVNADLQHLVDKWIGITVQNHVEELTLTIRFTILPYTSSFLLYTPPEIIFSAKSLKVLDCVNVGLPYYETMDLSSLESLTWIPVNVDKDMLQRIITFCPLIYLNITTGGHDEISLPWVQNRFEKTKGFNGGSEQSDVKTSMLRRLVYNGERVYSLWPWNINVGALKNLSKVEITGADITDDNVSDLASGLVALECLVLSSCRRLQCIQISSYSLKEFHVRNCLDLKKATVDTPNLLDFGYGGGVRTIVSLLQVQDCCNARFLPCVDLNNTYWFLFLKKFLMESNIFRSLVIDFPKHSRVQILAQEDALKSFTTCPPYKLRELKLRETDDWHCDVYSVTALVNGLFWSCRPDVLSITTSFYDLTAQTVLNILKDKVQCWKHPLKSVEVEGPNLSSLLTTVGKLEIRFRLSWKSF